MIEIKMTPEGDWGEYIRERTLATVAQTYSAVTTESRRSLKGQSGTTESPRKSGALIRGWRARQRFSRSRGRRVIEFRNLTRHGAILNNAPVIRGKINEHYRHGERTIQRNWNRILTLAISRAEKAVSRATDRRVRKARGF